MCWALPVAAEPIWIYDGSIPRFLNCFLLNKALKTSWVSAIKFSPSFLIKRNMGLENLDNPAPNKCNPVPAAAPVQNCFSFSMKVFLSSNSVFNTCIFSDCSCTSSFNSLPLLLNDCLCFF